MTRKKIFAAIVIVIILVVGLLWFLYFHKTTVANNSITGTITSITDMPNQAEDGYYGFEVNDSAGQKYTVDATGYLNTPLSPGSQGEACLIVPKVKVGDKVVFNLPKEENQKNVFGICFKKKLTGYYFKLN